MRKKREEIRSWLLENCVDENGMLDLMGLDFSGSKVDVDISHIKVSGDLYQDYQEVKGDLLQSSQTVKGDLWQNNQEVKGNLYQSFE